MILLTLVVWIVLYVRRIRFLVGHRVPAQKVATPEKVAAVIPEAVQYPANNFRNLFELPVLFYAVCLYLFVTGSVDIAYVIAAWVFVGLRAVHSAIQCTTNVVTHRFAVYAAGALALWFMVLRAALSAF